MVKPYSEMTLAELEAAELASSTADTVPAGVWYWLAYRRGEKAGIERASYVAVSAAHECPEEGDVYEACRDEACRDIATAIRALLNQEPSR